MRTYKKGTDKSMLPLEPEFFGRLWYESWTYIKTIVDVVREPVLILDKNLCVLAANEPFYRMFRVDPKDTEHTLVYKLGNGQWNIPALRKLLEDILPKHTFFKGFEVEHEFPSIGHKTMILNARRIYRQSDESGEFPPIIMLAIEDITEMIGVAEMLAHHTKEFQIKMSKKTNTLEHHIEMLRKEIKGLKKKRK